MKHVDLSRLPDFLKSRRWFGGKAWPIKTVQVIDHAELEAANGRMFTLGVVEVHYELGTPETYVLPVHTTPDGGIGEALEDDDLARGLLRVMREGLEVSTGGGKLRAERLPGAAEDLQALSVIPKVRHLGVEQTNTSVVFDDRTILKIIRRVEPGLSPEVEVGRHLTEVGFRHTPPLLGYLRLEGPADATLAVMHRFLRAEGDGWTHFLGAFKREKALTAGLLEDARKLGAHTAELHQALASPSSVPGFLPEPIAREDLQRWSSSIVGELGVSLSQATNQFPELEKRRDMLVARAQRLASVEPQGQKLRIHGDLHLGQVLRVDKGWQIFDFEGEPARSYQARRERLSPLRDVAGMLRSFSYADAAADLEGSSDPTRLKRARSAFLDGYLSTARGSDFLPSDETTFKQILEALELEKVLYELRYELQHRPTWARIPARTLLELEE